MKAACVFGLKVSHPYYADGVCPDFGIEPDAATARILEELPLPDQGRAGPGLHRDDEDTSFPQLGPELVLGFILRLQNRNFLRFTDLTNFRRTTTTTFSYAGGGG